MGWMHCTNAEGREIGYGVPATCDQRGCKAKIDRGLAYVCGDMHDGGEYGCGKYFCGKHLLVMLSGDAGQLCRRCSKEYDKEQTK